MKWVFSSRPSLFARHTFVSHQYIGSLLFFRNIYLSANMITVLKQNRPFIYLHNVCVSGAKALLRLHTYTEAQTFAAPLCDKDYKFISWGAQWLSGRVLDSRPRGRGFEPH